MLFQQKHCGVLEEVSCCLERRSQTTYKQLLKFSPTEITAQYFTST